MHPALITAAVFLAFATLHSLTVSSAFKSAALRVLGADRMRAYYRLGFTVFSITTFTAAAYVYFTLPDRFIYRPPGYVLWPMHVLQFLGAALMYAALRPFSAREFAGIKQAAAYLRSGETSGDIEGVSQGALVTTGAYGLVRHPMYVGGMAMFLFEPNVTGNCLVLRILATLYFIWGGYVEERRFRDEFGSEYESYMERVPRFNILAGLIRRLTR